MSAANDWQRLNWFLSGCLAALKEAAELQSCEAAETLNGEERVIPTWIYNVRVIWLTFYFLIGIQLYSKNIACIDDIWKGNVI